jgi:hypothetical protein
MNCRFSTPQFVHYHENTVYYKKKVSSKLKLAVEDLNQCMQSFALDLKV